MLIVAFASGFALAIALIFWGRKIRFFFLKKKNIKTPRLAISGEEPLAAPYRFHRLSTLSPRVKELLKAAEIISATSSTVLLEGESGTGKEVLARALHESGLRKGKPFVAIHAAAIPEGLLESELLGHEKGAFTGAMEKRKGRFELADGGTLFLDEVGELPPSLQVKLLRVIQERAFERLGGGDTVRVDIRIIAATNKSLRDLVAQKEFREDLYYRLNVVTLKLVPLRERKADLPLLASELVAKHAEKIGKIIAGVRPGFLEELGRFDFPGNIRELENMIERAIVFCQGEWLEGTGMAPDWGRREIQEWGGPMPMKIDVAAIIETY
ncbi:MAG: sigma-54 dependent transcriptional regulator, partial [bacterium]|nr:sigma-54 dependent transcriptional regulator [bacterium]